MAEPIPAEEVSNYETFRECLSEPVLRALSAPAEQPKKKRAHRKKGGKSNGEGNEAEADAKVGNEDGDLEKDTDSNDAEDLGEFIDYLTSQIFSSLPTPFRTLTHSKYKDSPTLQALYTVPLSISTTTSLLSSLVPPALDSLSSYGLLPSPSDALDHRNFFVPIYESYISAVTAPPPIWSTTRTTACELCHREWIPLTYHHLIPRSTHARVLKRGWHTEDRLGSVAWLCRACHSFVHRVAGNEELAKQWYTVELLEGREDVKTWV
ncbi:uncharacterized protein BDR25DRAFT_262091, partial [Lindgomyces ingoldianus]